MDDHSLDRRLPVDVLARLLADREAGCLAPLEAYLARFAGMEREVEDEYRRLVDSSRAPSGGPQTIGPYQLVRELGRGGQGTVWLARDPRLGREVALKLVPRSPLSGRVSERFGREARAASQLDHPGLCPVFDVGEDEAVAWIAMRYVPGRTLAEIQADRGGAAPDVRTATSLVEGLARAVHTAHEAGIVHRDVKPANVIVTPEGDPVLFDFGIARDDGRDDEGLELTQTGDSIGTPVYMSPEQLAGEAIDRRTDVWSLGVTLYELVAGRRPFDAPTRGAIVEAVLGREPESLRSANPSVPRDLEVVVATALSKERGRRYQTALALAEDLARVRAGRPVLARPIGPLGRLTRWARRNPAVAASLAAVILVLSGALLVTTRLLSETRAARDRSTALLGEVVQLADAKVAADLLAEEPTLWPAVPDRAPDLRAWLRRARALEARVDLHRAALARLVATLDQPSVASSAAAQFEVRGPDTRAWMEEQLTGIIASIERLIERIPAVEQRFEFAEALERRTVEQLAAEWEAAAGRVRGDPRFAGLELPPQLGLVPLGPDPGSGLEEFAHFASGELPVRDLTTGQLALTEASSIVLVLLPGGESTVGCEPPRPERPIGGPLVDAYARLNDGPIARLRLDPFFISKYELTSGQWQRHTGAPGGIHALPPSAGRKPVESQSNDALAEALGQLELVVPTEAQWEFAARGGTTTVWYTGDEPEFLAGHANLSDAGHGEDTPSSWQVVPWLDDGFLTTAPVGSFFANPFGLHDVVGNVFEWTSSPSLNLGDYPPAHGAGWVDPTLITHAIVRGGSFAKPETSGRSGFRAQIHRAHAWPDVGVRPARPVVLSR